MLLSGIATKCVGLVATFKTCVGLAGSRNRGRVGCVSGQVSSDWCVFYTYLVTVIVSGLNVDVSCEGSV